MREIKFKAYFKHKIRDVNFIDFKYKTIDIDVDGVATTTNIKNVNLLQYTGLKDKNGKEIYEGDIVKVMDRENGKLVVEWSSDSAEFMPFGSHDYAFDSKDVEVVGNIYEHSNLLNPQPYDPTK